MRKIFDIIYNDIGLYANADLITLPLKEEGIDVPFLSFWQCYYTKMEAQKDIAFVRGILLAKGYGLDVDIRYYSDNIEIPTEHLTVGNSFALEVAEPTPPSKAVSKRKNYFCDFSVYPRCLAVEDTDKWLEKKGNDYGFENESWSIEEMVAIIGEIVSNIKEIIN